MLKTALLSELRINPELQRKWDTKLARERALAPRDLQDQLSQEEYDRYNKEFDEFCSGYVKQELLEMESSLGLEKLDRASVAVPGTGLGRGLGFLETAIRMGMEIDLYDLSEKALSLTRQQIARLPESIRDEADRKTRFNLEELTGEEGQISFDSKLIVMSQFLQILSFETMRAVMRSLAENLRQSRDCRIVIVHRFDDRVDIQNGDTSRYTVADFLEPLRSGMYGEEVGVIRSSDDFLYFNYHDYRAITIARL